MPFRHALNACTLPLMCLTASLAMSLAQAAQAPPVTATDIRRAATTHMDPATFSSVTVDK